jgi:endonuclease/exonuclease/phosphatase family metal-dependent hydrolase
VLVPTADSTVRVFSSDGEYTLPEAAERVLQPNHPFLYEAAQELVTLCHHPAAGDFVLSGWQRDGPIITFGFENGAHAGPAPDELSGFAVVPEDAPFAPREGRTFMRGLDLREAALVHLKRSPTPLRPRPMKRSAECLRVLTYNVHSCVGMDGRMSPSRIARVIARYGPDIVALQELDVGRTRTGGVDQAHAIARELEMDYHFHPSLRVAEEQYGNAILSRYPMRLTHAGELPTLPIGLIPEPRGALWVTVDAGGQPVQIINTHFGLTRRERALQAEALMGPEWLGHPNCLHPVIVCGDLNDQPFSLPCRRIRGLLCDAQLAVNNHRPLSTWLGRYPLRRIDYVFVSRQIKVQSVKVPRTELIRAASDHLPLLVDLCIT